MVNDETRDQAKKDRITSTISMFGLRIFDDFNFQADFVSFTETLLFLEKKNKNNDVFAAEALCLFNHFR